MTTGQLVISPDEGDRWEIWSWCRAKMSMLARATLLLPSGGRSFTWLSEAFCLIGELFVPFPVSLLWHPAPCPTGYSVTPALSLSLNVRVHSFFVHPPSPIQESGDNHLAWGRWAHIWYWKGSGSRSTYSWLLRSSKSGWRNAHFIVLQQNVTV